VPDAPFAGHSDSELLGHWYKKEGKITNEMIDEQDGIFVFMLMDHKNGHFTVARDAMGICPLYWGKSADGSMWFASEMKAIQDVCAEFEIFPPVRRHFILLKPICPVRPADSPSSHPVVSRHCDRPGRGVSESAQAYFTQLR